MDLKDLTKRVENDKILAEKAALLFKELFDHCVDSLVEGVEGQKENLPENLTDKLREFKNLLLEKFPEVKIEDNSQLIKLARAVYIDNLVL